MAADVGVIRDANSLTNALSTILAMERDTRGDRRLANMLSTAKLIAAAAWERQETRGAQFRSDFPTADQQLAVRSYLTLADADAIAREATQSHDKPSAMIVAPVRAAAHA